MASSPPPPPPPPENCSSLSLLLAARAGSLRRCTTTVTRPDGRCYQETRTQRGFTALTSSGPGEDQEIPRALPGTGRGSQGEGYHSNHQEENLKIGALSQGKMTRTPHDSADSCERASTSCGSGSSREAGDDRHEGMSSEVLPFNRQCPGFVIDTKPDLRCSVILPYLLLGSQDVANDSNILRQFNVTHILSLVPPSLFNTGPQRFLQSDGSVVTSRPPRDAGVPSSDAGVPCSDAGVPCSDAGVPCSDAGVPSSDAGVPASDAEVPASDCVAPSLLLKQSALNGAPKQPAGELPANISLAATTQTFPPEVVYAPMLDVPDHRIIDSFPACHRFLAGVKGARGVALVHCNAGVSRAPTVVIAHLMTECGASCEEAMRMVKEKRSFIRPNAGFVDQLKQYEGLLTHRDAV